MKRNLILVFTSFVVEFCDFMDQLMAFSFSISDCLVY